jgi:hypothetical protein
VSENALKPFQFTSETAPRNGRPLNARNKLGTRFVTALQADFEEHGEDVIRLVRVERPAEYLKIIAAVMPEQLDFNVGGTVVVRWMREDERDDDYPAVVQHYE